MAGNKNILILGASSGIGIEIAHQFALNGWRLYLAGRRVEEIRKMYELGFENTIDGVYEFDAQKIEDHENFYTTLPVSPDLVIIAFAYNGPHDSSDTDIQTIERVIKTNFTGAVSVINIIKRDFLKRNEGTILVISSVAADRPKSKNYYYGASKAALSFFTEALRAELLYSAINIIHVKPGFVRTKILPEYAPEFITARPDTVAKDIYKAYLKKEKIVYTPTYWKWIMLVYRNMPSFFFSMIKK